MKAIHGGKAKNDRIDSLKIARLLRSNMIPQAYVYPKKMRSTRDLMRRRSHFVLSKADPTHELLKKMTPATHENLEHIIQEVKEIIRIKHYSRKTERVYYLWIRHFLSAYKIH